MSARARWMTWPIVRFAAEIGPILLGFAILEGPLRFAEWRQGARFAGDARPWAGALFVYAIAYGIYRVLAAHPVYRPGYRAWLETTPWSPAKPLPMGPVELSWRDGLVLALLIGLAATLPKPHAPMLLATFLTAHLLAMVPSFWLTRVEAFGYATAFALAIALRLWYHPAACLAALIGVYAIAYEGLRRGMARFPVGWARVPLLTQGVDTRDWPRPPCGWPYDRLLGEVRKDREIARTDAVLVSLLAAWWLDALISLMADPRERAMVAGMILLVVVGGGTAGRIVSYDQGYLSPMGLWGRIRTGCWIIPGYDKVLIAPLCVPTAAIATASLLWACRVPLASCFATAAGIAILAAIVTPPSLRRWRLTGRHRIVPTLSLDPSRNEFIRLS